MPLSILSKRLALFADDTRLGFRLVSRRWKQVERAKRKRIELAAVFSLLPLSAALATPWRLYPPLSSSINRRRSSVIESVTAPSITDQVTHLLAREDTHLREARVQRGETLAALFGRLGIADAAALRFAQTDAAARPLVRLAPGRFVQASITSDGALSWLKVHGAGDLDGALATTRILTIDRSKESRIRLSRSRD